MRPLGVHNCLPHSHGSQGCCAYHRSTLTRHYKEPVMAGSSSFTEGSAVFGGQANLLQAITNMFAMYNPDIIAVHTTCLSETIGDDIVQIISKAREEGKVPPGKHVIHANTPSYIGSHVTGFSSMVKGMVTYFAETTGRKRNQVKYHTRVGGTQRHARTPAAGPRHGRQSEYLPGHLRRVGRSANRKHEFYPKGGAPVEEIRHAGDSRSTLALGPTASEAAALALEDEVRGARRSAGAAHRPAGHRPLHQRAAPSLRRPRAQIRSPTSAAAWWT
jgi:nitrogenase molybdenum-iron protein beta chain